MFQIEVKIIFFVPSKLQDWRLTTNSLLSTSIFCNISLCLREVRSKTEKRITAEALPLSNHCLPVSFLSLGAVSADSGINLKIRAYLTIMEG